MKKGAEHRHYIRVAKPSDPEYEKGKNNLHAHTHLVSKEHTGALAKYHHDRAMRVQDRLETKSRHKANPIVKKVKPTAKGLEDEPSTEPKGTMHLKSVRRDYTNEMKKRIDEHRKANPGLPKGKVQEGFTKVTMPAVYAKLKYKYDPPNRLPGLRGKKELSEWHPRCATCEDSKKAATDALIKKKV